MSVQSPLVLGLGDRLSFTQDSPFFYSHLLSVEDSIDNLGTYLTEIIALTKSYVADLKKLSKSSDALATHLKQGVDRTKNNLSIYNMSNYLGDFISDISSSQDILAEELSRSFITPLEKFYNNEITRISMISKEYKRERTSHHDSIVKYLNYFDHPTTANLKANRYDSKAYNVITNRKKVELTRFDLIAAINEIDIKRRMEFSSVCVSALLSLKIHYFYCSERMVTSASYVNEMISRKESDRQEFEYSRIPVESYRSSVLGILDASVERCELSQVTDVSTSINSDMSATNLAISMFNFRSLMDSIKRSDADSAGVSASAVYLQDTEARIKALDKNELIEAQKKSDEGFPGVIKQGYVIHKTSKSIQRRWLVLDDIKLYFVLENTSTNGLEIQVLCDIMLASIKELSDCPFTFEIKYANIATHTIVCEGSRDFQEWIMVIKTQIEQRLTDGLVSPNAIVSLHHGVAVSSLSQPSNHKTTKNKEVIHSYVADILSRNSCCCDCNKEGSNIDWVSINLGLVMCLNCSGKHRALGTDISKVRSLKLDELDDLEYKLLLRIGNEVSNSIWDPLGPANNSDSSHPEYIKQKYQNKLYVRKDDIDEAKLVADIQDGSVLLLLHGLANNFNFMATKSDLLEIACLAGNAAAVCLLCLNNIDLKNVQLIIDKLRNQPESEDAFDITNYLTTKI
jgi:hypothetical protein